MQPGHTGRFVEATSIGSFVLAACRPIGWLVLAGERRLMELGEAETRARSMAERAAEANRAKSEFVRMIEAARRKFTPEFLNRLDKIVVTRSATR